MGEDITAANAAVVSLHAHVNALWHLIAAHMERTLPVAERIVILNEAMGGIQKLGDHPENKQAIHMLRTLLDKTSKVPGPHQVA
jgi:hypothetical protein